MLGRLIPSKPITNRLQHGRNRQRQRSQLRERIRREPALRLLPALLSVPLPFEGSPDYAAALLQAGQWVQLAGNPGSGRSLALVQLAWQWLQGKRTDPVIIVPLALLDHAQLSPREALRETLAEHGLAATLAVPDNDGGELLLLLDGWEELAAERRAAWEDLLPRLPRLLPSARIIVTVPEGTPAWEDFVQVRLAMPDAPLLRLWLEKLLPQHNTTAILQQLAANPELSILRQRILDVALLALTYPRQRLPAGHKQLYARVAEILQNQQISLPTVGSALHRDADAPDGWFLIGRHMLRCYTTAREIASSGSITPLVALEPAERSEVARIVRGMLINPAPLYATLWEADDPYTLAVCLLDNPRAAPLWAIRVLETLAPQPALPTGDSRAALLTDLPDLLRLAGNAISEERTIRLIAAVAPQLGSVRLLQLVDHVGQRPATRWAAADGLLRLHGHYAPALLVNTTPPDALSRAIRFYLLALAGPAERTLLTTPDTDTWAAAMFDPQVPTERRAYTAHVLLSSDELPAALRPVALALLPEGTAHEEHARTLLSRACSDSRPTVRQAALAALAVQEPTYALPLLEELLNDPLGKAHVQQDALHHVAHWHTPAAIALLLRSAMAEHLGLLLRLRAVTLLAAAPQPAELRHAALQHLINADRVPDVLVAVAARLLGSTHAHLATPDLCQLVTNQQESLLVRQAGIAALGTLGQEPALRDQVLATLRDVLQHEPGNTVLMLATLEALGQIGTGAALQIVRVVLRANLHPPIRQFWIGRVPDVVSVPVNRWHMLDLPAELHVMLAHLLDDANTDADVPTTFNDFLAAQIARVHRTGLAALGTIAAKTHNRRMHEVIHSLLLELTRTSPAHHAALHLLVQVPTDTPHHETLDLLIRAPETDPTVRWQAIELLGTLPNTGTTLLRWLEDPALDPFMRGRLALSLGESGYRSALPALRQIAAQPDGDLYLRTQAVRALGLMADPATEATLLHVIGDENAPASLRGAAAEALPATLCGQVRQWLRDMLRGERLPDELIAGVLDALGRQRNRESLAVLLHYAQYRQPLVATAALRALALIEDERAVPVLLNISQQPRIEPVVRLQAIATLIRLRGEEHAGLLRSYLDNGVLSLQLQAFDLMLQTTPDDRLIIRTLADRSAPLALRIRAAHALHQRPISHDTLHTVLLDERDAPHLRGLVADLLRTSTHPQTTHLLHQCAVATHTPPRLRRQCIAALTARAVQRPDDEPATLILIELAADNHAPPVQRDQIQRALVELALTTRPPAALAAEQSPTLEPEPTEK